MFKAQPGWKSDAVSFHFILTSEGDYNINRYGIEERARKQALPFIEKPMQNQYTTD